MRSIFKLYIFKLVVLSITMIFMNFPSHAFISDTKIIECSRLGHDRKVFKFQKILLSEPTLSQRKNGLWKPYCSEGKLRFNEDSIMCKSKTHNSTLDLITNQYIYFKKLKPITEYKFVPLLEEKYYCLINGK